MSLLKDTEKYATSKLENELDPNLVYHNLEHTVEVVSNCRILSEKISISKYEKEILLVAAWLHDIGFVQSFTNHEEESAKIAADFLQDKAPKEFIQEVNRLILSTRATIQPSGILEKILHDADTFNVGTDSFVDRSKLLKSEMEFIADKKFSDKEWLELQLLFFATHDFKTEYCKKKYGKKRLQNISYLQKSAG